jgi:broad specificity phosphatase PhoE
MRALELRRHAPRDKEEDRLTPEGQRLAEEVGRELPGGYAAVFSSPTKRAAETVAWFLRGLGQPLPDQHGVSEGLASPMEDRWRAAGKASGTGRIDDIEGVDRDLVEQEAARLGGVVRELLASLPKDGRGLAVGHSPLIEAAVYGTAGTVIEPLDECEGVLIEGDGGELRLTQEYRRR